ncbi:MAG: hypothetical protein JSW11_11990 [Candidatus Heimdallarchaeota archaeon]|nr:MAG: hypothetical protein JSW11_11990 [Candidatus Heimdallarchaeota archaeon]
MPTNNLAPGMIFNIAILSFLDKPVDHIIQAFLQKYPDKIKNQETDVSLNLVSILFETDQKIFKINLMQPISPYLIDKLAKRYYQEKEGAIILFSKNHDYSFKAAKTFYKKLTKENEDFPIPIAFVELLAVDDSSQLNIKEPEILEETPHVAYYGLTENADGFESILQFIIRNYNTTLRH